MRNKAKPQKRDTVEDFVGVAQKFCTLVRSSKEQELSTFLSNVACLLGELYGRAFLLPDVSPATNRNRLTEERVDHHVRQYKILNKQLSERLGKRNRYWKVFDPTDEKSLVSATLSDDLADICLDLEDGLALRSESERHDFPWQLRFDFRNHWGRHAVSALNAIHHVVAWDYE